MVQQISTGQANDYNAVISPDSNLIYFHRGDGSYSFSLWSFNRENSLFSSYSRGMNPCPVPNAPSTLYCTRFTDKREGEIWKINYETGVEKVLLSQPGKSFTTPRLSPNGRWIICMGTGETGKSQNVDVFVIRTDGTQLTQLTYHPGNDMYPVWAPDGRSVYFVSQRGAQDAKTYNIWKMDFNL